MRLTDVLRTSGLRIGVYFLILFSASSLALIALIYWRTETFLTRQTDGWLQREASALIHDTPAQRLESLARHIESDVNHARPFVLFSSDRKPVAGEAVAFPGVAKHGGPASFSLILKGKTQKYRGIIIDLPDGQTLLVSQNAHLIQRFSQDLIGAMAAGSGLLVLIGLIAAFFLGWSTTRRIDRMASTIKHIVSGQLRDRLPRNGRLDDLDRLGDVVNDMLDEIERLMHEVKGVCDGVAHDLRTPLTGLLGLLERTNRRATSVDEYREGMNVAIKETTKILARFSAMLRISEVEDGARRSGFQRIDLVEVVRDAAEFYEPFSAAKDVRLSFHSPTSGGIAKIDGDSSLIFDAVCNLLDNAVKASSAGAEIRIIVGARDRRRWIEISDAGPGIPPDQRDAVLRRFYRVDTDLPQQGSGLGLSLVSAIARLHGMTLTLSDAEPGCRVVLAVEVD